MDTLLKLPFEFQVVLLAGYLGYKTSVAGRTVVHRTEDFLLQVLVFGSAGRLLGSVIGFIPYFETASEIARLTLTAAVAVLISVGLAALWRTIGQRLWVRAMAGTGVFRDDLEASAWGSMLAAKAQWSYVQLHCDDGNVYESCFDDLPADLPSPPVVLNEDGVVLYVTRLHRKDDTTVDFPVANDGSAYPAEYFPRSTLKRVTVGWRKL